MLSYGLKYEFDQFALETTKELVVNLLHKPSPELVQFNDDLQNYDAATAKATLKKGRAFIDNYSANIIDDFGENVSKVSKAFHIDDEYADTFTDSFVSSQLIY